MLVCVFLLCSFSSENENKDLHNKSFLEGSNEKISKENGDIYGTEEELSKIYEEFLSVLPSDVPRDIKEVSGVVSAASVFEYIADVLKSESSAKTFFSFIAIAMIFSLFEVLSADLGEISQTVKAAFSVALALPVFELMKEALAAVGDGIGSGSEIFSKIIPTVLAVTAIGKGTATAAAAGTAMSFALSFVSELLSGLILPISSLIFSASMLSSFDTGALTGGIVKGARGWFNTLIGISSLIVVSTLACQTLITAAADSTLQKGARYAISNMIPIVGGVVSGALSTLISGVKLLSGTVGVLSCVALLSVMGAPLVKLLFLRFCVGTCITVTSFSGGSFGERFFTSLRSAIDTVVAILASSLLIYVLEIIIVTKTLGG